MLHKLVALKQKYEHMFKGALSPLRKYIQTVTHFAVSNEFINSFHPEPHELETRQTFICGPNHLS